MGFDHLLLLAAIQGITEFIPVSSSGHLVLAHEISGASGASLASGAVAQPMLDVALHFGTLLAVMIYFRRDVARLAQGGLDVLRHKKARRAKPPSPSTIATLPVLLAAALLMGLGAIDALRRAETVAWASIIFAVPLYVADRFGSNAKTLEHMAVKPAFILGLAQMLALIPGASRAGVTLMAARGLGFSREAAARYSMLMAMPVIWPLPVRSCWTGRDGPI